MKKTIFGFSVLSAVLICSLVLGGLSAVGYATFKVYSGDEVHIFGYVFNNQEDVNIDVYFDLVDEDGSWYYPDTDEGQAEIYFDSNGNGVLDVEDELIETINIPSGYGFTQVHKEGTYFAKVIGIGDYEIQYTVSYTASTPSPITQTISISADAFDMSCVTNMLGTNCDGGDITGEVRDWDSNLIQGANVEVRILETGEVLTTTTDSLGYFEVQAEDTPTCDFSGTDYIRNLEIRASYLGINQLETKTMSVSNRCLI